MHNLEIRERVRERRRNPTPSEKAPWQNLKGKKLLGFRFLRLHQIIYHAVRQECRKKDFNRDQIINSLGLWVLRIRNEELFNMPAVLQIRQELQDQLNTIDWQVLKGLGQNTHAASIIRVQSSMLPPASAGG
jgi:very-short-patch-repair endonuclease